MTKLINHRHHLHCVECTSAKEERAVLKTVGIGWGSAQALQLHRRQFLRLGMSRKAIDRAMRVVHPPLMEHLKITADLRIVPADRRYYWEWHRGWGLRQAVLRRQKEEADRRAWALAQSWKQWRRSQLESRRQAAARRKRRSRRTR